MSTITTNPWTILRQAVQTALAGVDGLNAAAVRGYNNEAMDEIAARGKELGRCVAYARIAQGAKQQDAAGYGDPTETLVNVYLVAVGLGPRQTHQELAELVLWRVYKALRGNALTLTWLDCGLQWREWETVYAEPTVTILSLVWATRFDQDAWTTA